MIPTLRRSDRRRRRDQTDRAACRQCRANRTMSAPSSNALSPSITPLSSTFPARALLRASYAPHPSNSLSSSIVTTLSRRDSSHSRGANERSADGTPDAGTRLSSSASARNIAHSDNASGMAVILFRRASIASSRAHLDSSPGSAVSLFLATDSRSSRARSPIADGSASISLPSALSSLSSRSAPISPGSSPVSALSSIASTCKLLDSAPHTSIHAIDRVVSAFPLSRSRVRRVNAANDGGTAATRLPWRSTTRAASRSAHTSSGMASSAASRRPTMPVFSHAASRDAVVAAAARRFASCVVVSEARDDARLASASFAAFAARLARSAACPAVGGAGAPPPPPPLLAISITVTLPPGVASPPLHACAAIDLDASSTLPFARSF
eukprot:31439-Pelagococcus_subviridis.AAC.3